MEIIFIITTAVTLIGCNDVNINTSKSGPADDFLRAFNDVSGEAIYRLSVNIEPADWGIVRLLPEPESADSAYTANTQVTLAAMPSNFIYVFSEWSGTGAPTGVDRTDSEISVTMDANRIIIANFRLHPLILNEQARQAWVDNIMFVGFILRADGTFVRVALNNGVWGEDPLALEVRGNWSADGVTEGTLRLGSNANYEYEVDEVRGRLTLTQAGRGSAIYTIRNDINVN